MENLVQEYYKLICYDREYFKTYKCTEEDFFEPGLELMGEFLLEWRRIKNLQELREKITQGEVRGLLKIEDYYSDELVDLAKKDLNITSEEWNEEKFELFFSNKNLESLLHEDEVSKQMKECIKIYFSTCETCKKLYSIIKKNDANKYKGKMNELFEFNYQARTDKDVKRITNLEEYAKILVKCKILDNRNNDYNKEGFEFEELLYSELMEIRSWFCAEFLYLIEYSLYFEQRNQNPIMVKQIYEAIKFAIDIIKETKEERKKCRYNSIIEKIKCYEQNFYGNTLKDMTETEKDKYIKENIINNAGEILYYIQFYKLTHNDSEKLNEDYWEIAIRLVSILDKRGKQKEIKVDRTMNERIRKKNLIYSLNKKDNNV